MMLLIEQRLKSRRGDWSKKVSLCRVSTTVERALAVQQQLFGFPVLYTETHVDT